MNKRRRYIVCLIDLQDNLKQRGVWSLATNCDFVYISECVKAIMPAIDSRFAIDIQDTGESELQFNDTLSKLLKAIKTHAVQYIQYENKSHRPHLTHRFFQPLHDSVPNPLNLGTDDPDWYNIFHGV